jgi:hypothetical protein
MVNAGMLECWNNVGAVRRQLGAMPAPARIIPAFQHSSIPAFCHRQV